MRRLMIDCSDAGTGEGALTPNIWQISYPYSNQGGWFCPPFTTGTPKILSPSGITGLYYKSYTYRIQNAVFLTIIYQVDNSYVFICGQTFVWTYWLKDLSAFVPYYDWPLLRCNGKTQVHQILINLLKICRNSKGPAWGIYYFFLISTL